MIQLNLLGIAFVWLVHVKNCRCFAKGKREEAGLSQNREQGISNCNRRSTQSSYPLESTASTIVWKAEQFHSVLLFRFIYFYQLRIFPRQAKNDMGHWILVWVINIRSLAKFEHRFCTAPTKRSGISRVKGGQYPQGFRLRVLNVMKPKVNTRILYIVLRSFMVINRDRLISFINRFTGMAYVKT